MNFQKEESLDLKFMNNMKRVVCVDVGGVNLTNGKIYGVINEGNRENIIFIFNDYGIKRWYSRDRFMTIEEYRNSKINNILG
jgi:hypothetical protein